MVGVLSVWLAFFAMGDDRVVVWEMGEVCGLHLQSVFRVDVDGG